MPLLLVCAVDKGATNKAAGRLQGAEAGHYWSDLPGPADVCSPASLSYQQWSVWPWERADETGGVLSVIRSGFVSLRRDWSQEWKPLPPPPGPRLLMAAV